MKTSNRFRTFLAVLFAVILQPACEQEQKASAPIIRPVRTYQVYSTGGTRIRTFSGTAHAGLESRLSFRVPGKVKRRFVKVGDAVRAGQLIAELEPEDYLLQFQEADASLDRAKAEQRNAEANYARVRALYENRNASRNDLDAARAAAESSRAQVTSIEKRLDLARSQLSYAKLKASTAGSIASVEVEENENVQAGQTVVILTSGSQPEVKVAIPGILISQVTQGGKVKVTMDAFPGKTFPAVVTEVGVATTGMSTTYPVTVRLKEEQKDILPGMAAEVAFRFESRDRRERFLIPPVAVGEDRQGRYVYVVAPGDEEGLGRATRRAVTVGELREEGLEVLFGLSDGDLVVIAGVSRITDGQTVKLLEAEKRRP